jgi:hypothetical protein
MIMKIKLLSALAVTLIVTGCGSLGSSSKTASGPDRDGVYRLQGYSGPEAMENMEVMQASRDCINNRMRPNVSYLMVRTDQGKTRVPVSVVCEPF